MTEPDWQRVDPTKHSWIVQRDAEEEMDWKNEDTYIQRFYVPKGKRKWPLLSLLIMSDQGAKMQGRHRLNISKGSIKTGPNAWWEENYGIPSQLLGDLNEMFAEWMRAVQN